MSERIWDTLYNAIPITIIPIELKTSNTHQKLALDKITKLVEYRNFVNLKKIPQNSCNRKFLCVKCHDHHKKS